MYYRAYVINRGGEMPYVNPVNNEALLDREELEKRSDNPEVLKRLGIRNIAVEILPSHWHIIQVGGYSRLEGLFCHCY